MYSGGPEFWNRRNHTVRNAPHPKAREWAKNLLPPTSIPGLIEDSKLLRWQIQERLRKKDVHGQNGRTEFTGRNHLMRAFNRAHRGPGVLIDVVEFKRGLEEFRIDASDTALQELFNEYDHTQAGKINFCEFVARMGPQENIDNIESVKERLRSFEQKNPGELYCSFEKVGQNGTITPVEMRRIMAEFDIKISDWDYNEMLTSVEQLHGMILFEDFLEKFAFPEQSFSMTISPRGTSRKADKKIKPHTPHTVSNLAQKGADNLMKGLDLGMEIRPATPTASSESFGSSRSHRVLPTAKFRSLSPRRPQTQDSRISMISAPKPRSPSSQSSRSFASPRSMILRNNSHTPREGQLNKTFASTWASAPDDSAACMYKALLRSFLGLDLKRCGKITSQEFRSVLIQHKFQQMLPSDELSRIISSKSDVEEAGFVNYMNFLRHFKAAVKRFSVPETVTPRT